MALVWSDVVGDGTLANGGYVGDLMEVARAHIDESVRLNRLKQDEAGQVYASMIENAIQTGIKYAIDEESLRLGLIPSTLAKG